MTTMEHVIELVRRLDDEKLEALERELVVELGDDAETPTLRHDPLGAFIGMDDGIDGPTDVSGNVRKYVADAIQHR